MDLQDLGAQLIRIGSSLRLGHALQEAGIRNHVALALLAAAIEPRLILKQTINEDQQEYRDPSSGMILGLQSRISSIDVSIVPHPSLN